MGHGEAPIELNSFATAITSWALLPFALSIGVDLFIVTDTMGHLFAVLVGALFTSAALFLWYGLGMVVHSRRSSQPTRQSPMERKKEEIHADRPTPTAEGGFLNRSQ